MQDSVEGDDVATEKREVVSPKVTRPALPKFGSHGHHRHKTDPGQTAEIKNLMEEIKKWKDGSIFDKSPIRPKVIKPQTIPKAHSTQTSPRTSPPPGSPNVGRSSSLNRNRSRSLKLLTDKLKSGRGHSAGSTKPSLHLQIPKIGTAFKSSKSADATETDPPVFPNTYEPSSEESSSARETTGEQTEPEKGSFVETIPERDEKEEEDEDKKIDSAIETLATPEKGQMDAQARLNSPIGPARSLEEEGISLSDTDTPTTDSGTHTSSYTLHPIDRNSAFLRLRQTAPPKRRPGYAGLALPKTKISGLHKSHGHEHGHGHKDKDHSVEHSVKKPNKLDLSGSGHTRSKSGSRFPIHFPHSKGAYQEDGSVDPNGYAWFRSPSTDSPPPLPGEHSDGSLESPADAPCRGLGDGSELGPVFGRDEESVSQEDSEDRQGDKDKQEKRNGKSPKHKSKSDPSGNKSFDFDVSGVINSSQSHSFPLLGRDNETEVSVSDVKDSDESVSTAGEEVKEPSIQTTDLDVVNNNDEAQPGNERLSLCSETGKSSTTSVSEDMIFSPQSEMSEPFEDSMTRSTDTDEYHSVDSGDITSPQDLEGEGEEGIGFLASSVHSFGSENSFPSTPISCSPTGTLEKEENHLNVPSPKRPILRSVSSASVLQRERKFSGGNKKKEKLDNTRKHSLTVGDEVVPMDGKSGDFLLIGDTGSSAISMPLVWNTERNLSVSPERDEPHVKDKRYHIVEELYRNEKEYVDALKMLKERYMDPLKTVSGIDERVIDNIFYMIPEILTHHQIYLEFLNQVWTKWKTDSSTVGDIILKTFSGQSVQNSYLSFVENYKTSGKVIENALQTKSSVQKFVEQCQRESGSKLSMKDLIVRPIQRIPRYELLIQRLLVNTPGEHPDYSLLREAEKVMHEFARKIGTANETQIEDGQQETLKKLEMLLITDLAVPDRFYLKHDMLQMAVDGQNKKDQCCIWMFSDLIIISSIKRKGGPVTRKVSIILKSPTGQDFAENVKHKVWLRVGLDDIEIVKSQDTLKRTSTLDKEQVEEDLDLLEMIQDLSNKLNCTHNGLDEVLSDISTSLNKQLVEHNLRTSLLDTNKMELLVTTQEGVTNLEVTFPSGEKRALWEATFLDAKQKLSLLSDKRAPEFLQPLQITKTRAGMQFSCAAPIDGFNSNGHRDIWVCNSDGYVGHMCLLSLQPEPIVTLNTPVPGCNARILCIAAVPAHGCLRRKSSAKRYKGPSSPSSDGPRISVEEVDSAITEEEPAISTQHSTQEVDDGPQLQGDDIGDTVSEEGYQSDSSGSSSETDDDFISSRELFVEDYEVKQPQLSQMAQSSPDSITTTGSWTQDPHKSTMWLGTEDGCIHIFQCTDNIKTTKNKLKIQLGYPVYCIIYLDNKVFVSLSNGDLIVYRRDIGGTWDTENPYTRAIGSVTAPIVKMLAVAGKLWCGRQNHICVINPLTLSIEKTFQVHQDSNRCVQCIVNSGQGVWIASQQSSKMLLYHATTFEFLMEVSIAQAVNQKLQSADDIIRQHKAACLRITALLVCKDLLWIGTSAGVILTIPMPKITSTTIHGSLTLPNVTGLVYGHTGHVRFLTCVELSNSNVPPLLQGSSASRSDSVNNNDNAEPPAPHEIHARRSSVATMTATLATRMLVISGGDGYEDFRNNVANESAGKDDSTNHLLMWNV